ncbi:MAG: hypothetical protein WCH39_07675 [Schlesneria sp.]
MNGTMLSGSVGLDSLQMSLNTRTNHLIGKFDSQCRCDQVYGSNVITTSVTRNTDSEENRAAGVASGSVSR